MNVKKQKTHINAKGCHHSAFLNVVLQTNQHLTTDELRHERKDLNNHLMEALHKYGFHRQDITVTNTQAT